MRKILLALVLIAATRVSGYAQTQAHGGLTSSSKIYPVGPSTGIDERRTGNTSHVLIWTKTGTVSSCVLKLQSSVDGVTFGTDVITVADCTTNGTSALTTAYGNYFRINATTLTGSGTLNVNYFAFPPGQSLTATVDTTGLATSAKQDTQQTSLTAIADVDGTTADAAATQGSTGTISAKLRTITSQLNTLNGLAATDPCAGVLTTGADLHLASTTVTPIITAASAKKNYICSMEIVVGGTAEIVSLVEGTTAAACASPAVVWGSVTAASGFAFGANGGIMMNKTITGKATNKDTCVQTSGSNAITVHIEYVQQ